MILQKNLRKTTHRNTEKMIQLNHPMRKSPPGKVALSNRDQAVTLTRTLSTLPPLLSKFPPQLPPPLPRPTKPTNHHTPMWRSLQWLSTITNTSGQPWQRSTPTSRSSSRTLRKTRRDGRIPFDTTCRSMIVSLRWPRRELGKEKAIIGHWVSEE